MDSTNSRILYLLFFQAAHRKDDATDVYAMYEVGKLQTEQNEICLGCVMLQMESYFIIHDAAYLTTSSVVISARKFAISMVLETTLVTPINPSNKIYG